MALFTAAASEPGALGSRDNETRSSVSKTKYELAHEAWPFLTRWAAQNARPTYTELAAVLGYRSARVARQPLWALADFCTEKELPPLTSIVVSKSTGEPGAGFTWEGGIRDAQERAQAYDWSTVAAPFPPGFLRDDTTSGPASTMGHHVPDKKVQSNGRGPYQAEFRRRLQRVYGGSCALCRTKHRAFLVASHIVPWALDSHNRLNPRNGILLCVLHDRAFEEGAVRVHKDLSVEVLSLGSGAGSSLLRALADTSARLRVALPRLRPDPEFLAWRLSRKAPARA